MPRYHALEKTTLFKKNEEIHENKKSKYIPNLKHKPVDAVKPGIAFPPFNFKSALKSMMTQNNGFTKSSK